jgi:hypothetical protein
VARMFPTNRPRQGTRSALERKLYYELKQHLGDPFLVFHGVRFARRTAQGTDREGDFIIVHPAFGILIIEVKAGDVHYDGRTNTWLINGEERESPIAQVHAERYAVEAHVRSHPSTKRFARSLTYDTAVWFLTCHRQQLHLPDMPDTNLLFAEDVYEQQYDQAMTTILRQRGRQQRTLHQREIQDLIKAFSPTFDLHSDLRTRMDVNRLALEQITAEQFETLFRILSHQRQLLIPGASGTGKTVLAYEAAWRFAEQGDRVLFLCQSPYLAGWLQAEYARSDKTPKPPLAIHYPKSLAAELHARVQKSATHLEVLSNLGGQQQLGDAMRECIALLHARHAQGWHYDTIIIDEGQDIESNLFQAVLPLLRDQTNGRFFVFYDEAQRIDFPTPWVPPKHGMVKMEDLTDNCRNTKSVFDFMQEFHPLRHAQRMTFPEEGPLGEPVRWIAPRATNGQTPDDALEATLLTILLQLIGHEHVFAEHILIVSFRSEAKSRFLTWKEHWKGQLALRHIKEKDRPGVIPFLTVRAAKGLESDVVIFVELDGLPQADTTKREKLIYLGASRCRHSLIVLGTLQELTQGKALQQQLML